MIVIPPDLDRVIDEAWEATKNIPGYLLQNEARFLGVLAALVPATGVIVEIGSYRGRSTVMLGKVAARYGLGPVVAIDPHNSPILLPAQGAHQPSSYTDFLASIREAGLEQIVEPHLAYSRDVSAAWTRPIRLLWIDGDHSYSGAKTDFDGFFPHLAANGVVALHDALNTCVGPRCAFSWSKCCCRGGLGRPGLCIRLLGRNSGQMMRRRSRRRRTIWIGAPRG
jgi:predicted O-methyltransferase YrrM